MRNARNAIFAAVLLIAAAADSIAGENPDAAFARGNQLYDQQKFDEAGKAYAQAVADGRYSANLFFNLGNAWFRLGDKGRAILNYERALALEPTHPEARANLTFVEDRSGARKLAMTRLQRWLASVGVNTYTLLACGAFWVCVFCAAILIALRPAKTGGVKAALVLSLGLLAVSGLALYELQGGRANPQLAVVTAGNAQARFAPAENAKLALPLPAGSRVRVLSERGSWSYVELPDSGRGWVANGALERVRLAPRRGA